MTKLTVSALAGLACCLGGAVSAADLPVAGEVAAESIDQTWSAVFNTDFRFSTFTGSRAVPAPQNGVFAALPVRGRGSQVYIPVALQVVGQPVTDVKVEATIRGGYVYSEQRTFQSAGSVSTPVDTVVALTATYLGFAGFQPFLSLNANIPVGRAALFGPTRGFARLDPDLVDVPAFGAGFNVGPTVGVNIPLNDNFILTAGVGYTDIGAFNREGIVDPFTGVQASTKLDPGDATSFNVSLGYTEGAFAATVAGVYTITSATSFNDIRSFRGGDSYSFTGNVSYGFTEEFTATLTASFTHTEANLAQVPGGAVLLRENPNSNSNVFRIGVDSLYRFTSEFSAGPTASFLYRDRNAILPTELQFVPAKERYAVGAVANYAATDWGTVNARVEHIWTEERGRPDQVFPGFGAVPGTGTGRLAYQGWQVSSGFNVRFRRRAVMTTSRIALAPLALAARGLLADGAQAQAPRRGPVPAPAAQRCPEGRTADGRCVNPRLAFIMRQQACVLSQPRLSFIAPPCTLPSGTGVLLVDRNVVDRNYNYPANTVTNPNPRFDLFFERRYYSSPYGP